MAEVHKDERRGHFVMVLPHRAGHDTGRGSEAVGCDLGSTLHLTTSGVHMTPEEALELAGALTWWANRKRTSEAITRLEVAGEPYDLLTILHEEAS